jgi:hypothetical protein
VKNNPDIISIEIFLSHAYKVRELLNNMSTEPLLSGYKMVSEKAKSKIFKVDDEGRHGFVAILGTTLLSTSKSFLQKLETIPILNIKPIVFDWALESVPKLTPLLWTKSLEVSGYRIRGVVLRDRKTDDYLDFDFTDRKRQSRCVPIIQKLLMDETFESFSVVTIDLISLSENPIVSIMIDWDGRIVVDANNSFEQEKIVSCFFESYQKISGALDLDTQPFSLSILESKGFRDDLINLYLSNNWSRQSQLPPTETKCVSQSTNITNGVN